MCGLVRSSANCLALTNFLRREVPVFLTNLKIGCGGGAVDEMREPVMFALADELEVSVKLFVLLRVGSILLTDSTKSWSLPKVDMTRTAGSGDLGTRMLLLELALYCTQLCGLSGSGLQFTVIDC